MAKRRQKKTAPVAPRWVQMSRRTYLERNLAETHLDIEAARDAESWQAVATLRMRARDIRTELDELAAASKEPASATDGKTRAELMAMLVEALRSLPMTLLDDVLDEIGAERSVRGPVLRVVDSP